VPASNKNNIFARLRQSPAKIPPNSASPKYSNTHFSLLIKELYPDPSIRQLEKNRVQSAKQIPVLTGKTLIKGKENERKRILPKT